MQTEYTQRVQQTCEQCGAPARIGRRFCSRGCSNRSRSLGTIERTCDACGKSFVVRVRDANLRPVRYCSNACRNLGHQKREYRTCATCGQPFFVRASELTKPNRTNLYCSLKCRVRPLGIRHSEETRAKMSARHKAEYANGKRPWNFRGGKDPYYGPNWYQQAELVRQCDNYTCQDCGKQQRRPKLHVHHIMPRRTFHGDYLAANQPSNLVTLCNSCHSKRQERWLRRSP